MAAKPELFTTSEGMKSRAGSFALPTPRCHSGLLAAGSLVALSLMWLLLKVRRANDS